MVSSFFTMRHRSGRILTSQLSFASSSSCASFQCSNSLSFRNEPHDGTARSCADKLRCMTSILELELQDHRRSCSQPAGVKTPPSPLSSASSLPVIWRTRSPPNQKAGSGGLANERLKSRTWAHCLKNFRAKKEPCTEFTSHW